MNYLLLALLASIIIAAAIALVFQNQSTKIADLHVGDFAPDFTLLDSDSKSRQLSEFLGKDIVLYFYPKAETPGCTQEACSIRDSYDDFKNNDSVVLGVSYDTPESQKHFKDKHHLPFILLSDTKKIVAKKYGAYQGSLNELFPNRMTFIIDKAGKIKKIFPKVDVSTHTAQILKAIQE